ncbi:MAG: phosphogluconate 2-dehydrogenase [Rhodoferax sp.]|jgi:phosphogluconate 2-dehydrogenase
MQPNTTNTAHKKVLVFRELPPDQLARLKAQHDVTQANPRLPEQVEAFHTALATAEGMIGSSYAITAALLANTAKLKVISSVSVGVDNYALSELAERGITLCCTPGVLTETTADTIFSLMMASSRRLVELANCVREGRWTRNISEDLFGWNVNGKKLEI